MTYVVRLREEADLDIADAASWYEEQREGLGGKFLDELLHIFGLIQENPLFYPLIRRNTRRAVMSRFPFAVFYRVVDHDLVVVAVMHGSRHPKAWKSRR